MTKAKLPIARSNGSTDLVLSSESLHKIIQLAGNHVETLEYLQSSLYDKVKKSAEYAGLMQEVAKLVENAVFQEQEKEKVNPWSGIPGLAGLLKAYYSTTEFSAFQEFMASKSGSNIQEEQIILDYALSRSAEFKRAYTSEGDMLAGASLDAMDILFNAWLAKNDLISQDGIIYVGTSKGEIKQMNGAPVTVDPDKVVALLDGGAFEQYVQEKNHKVHITVRANDYGEPQPATEQPQS